MTAVIAHRGASVDAPENTLAAFKLAWEQEADSVEMDLWPTRDGRIAVIHDEDLLRVAGLDEKVGALDAAELIEVDVGRWKGMRWAGECIPMLEEALATVPSARRVFLELKAGHRMLPEIERCILGSGLDVSRICIIAFDRALLLQSKQRMPGTEHAWIVDRPRSCSFGELIVGAASSGLDALDLEASWPLDRPRVELAHRAGLKVYVWTVDDMKMARHLADAGVDGITTNAPALLRRALQPIP